MALLTAEEQIVEFERTRQGVVYPYEELFGRFLEDETLNFAGNVGFVGFPTVFRAGQVWVLDQFGFVNNGVVPKIVSGSITLEGSTMWTALVSVNIGNTHCIALLPQPIYFDNALGAQVAGGGAVDTVSLHARRVL